MSQSYEARSTGKGSYKEVKHKEVKGEKRWVKLK